ncbi:NAD(P)H-quinone oxidoreductase [Candidatus Obscuribacterales bacterium]|nr:NAD(P)H-quinone oxidoreductase [Candidatus Obscuribacterales bacterium]MBX3134829.1 NAD(P)H-quinone oxidoreductase [Candidatus Obscuribacterales bacterium]MBX3149524.1 NAD(P)H-quinone oxidoreductase [Candidatus Obscuribacterales bacterium]
MKAAIVTGSGGPEVLKVQDVPEPRASKGEVRVRVMATAVNRADVIQRKGGYPAPPGVPSNILGLEYAGVITDVGEDVSGFEPGDRVFGLVGGGSYAQFIVTHHRTIAKVPDNLSFEQAAACPEAFVTAYDAMVSQANLKSGEWVLIHAAGSGVGTAAVQICRALGARSVGTSRTKDKIDRAMELGLHRGIVIEKGDFSDEVKTIVGDQGVDVVLELIGGNYVVEDLECVANQGRIILVGLLAGAKAELSLQRILSKRVMIKGTTLRARPLEEKIVAAQLLSKQIAPLLENGELKPIIDKVFDLDDVVEAHRYVEQNDSFGKVVLNLED